MFIHTKDNSLFKNGFTNIEIYQNVQLNFSIYYTSTIFI